MNRAERRARTARIQEQRLKLYLNWWTDFYRRWQCVSTNEKWPSDSFIGHLRRHHPFGCPAGRWCVCHMDKTWHGGARGHGPRSVPPLEE